MSFGTEEVSSDMHNQRILGRSLQQQRKFIFECFFSPFVDLFLLTHQEHCFLCSTVYSSILYRFQSLHDCTNGWLVRGLVEGPSAQLCTVDYRVLTLRFSARVDHISPSWWSRQYSRAVSIPACQSEDHGFKPRARHP